jgi:hypothetical protein
MKKIHYLTLLVSLVILNTAHGKTIKIDTLEKLAIFVTNNGEWPGMKPEDKVMFTKAKVVIEADKFDRDFSNGEHIVPLPGEVLINMARFTFADQTPQAPYSDLVLSPVLKKQLTVHSKEDYLRVANLMRMIFLPKKTGLKSNYATWKYMLRCCVAHPLDSMDPRKDTASGEYAHVASHVMEPQVEPEEMATIADQPSEGHHASHPAMAAPAAMEDQQPMVHPVQSHRMSAALKPVHVPNKHNNPFMNQDVITLKDRLPVVLRLFKDPSEKERAHQDLTNLLTALHTKTQDAKYDPVNGTYAKQYLNS